MAFTYHPLLPVAFMLIVEVHLAEESQMLLAHTGPLRQFGPGTTFYEAAGRSGNSLGFPRES